MYVRSLSPWEGSEIMQLLCSSGMLVGLQVYQVGLLTSMTCVLVLVCAFLLLLPSVLSLLLISWFLCVGPGMLVIHTGTEFARLHAPLLLILAVWC